MEDPNIIPELSLPIAFEANFGEKRGNTPNSEIMEDGAANQGSSGSSASTVTTKKFSIRNHLKNARSSRA